MPTVTARPYGRQVSMKGSGRFSSRLAAVSITGVILAAGIFVASASALALWLLRLHTDAGIGRGPFLDPTEYCRLNGHTGPFSEETWPPRYSCGSTIVTSTEVTNELMATWTIWSHVLWIAVFLAVLSLSALVVAAFRRGPGTDAAPAPSR